MQRETALEKSCIEYVNANGGQLLKLTGYAGIPDRMLLVQGKVVFIEFKDSLGVQSKVQKIWAKILENNGFSYHIVRNKAKFIKLYQEVIEND
jgi:hypothetical protein